MQDQEEPNQSIDPALSEPLISSPPVGGGGDAASTPADGGGVAPAPGSEDNPVLAKVDGGEGEGEKHEGGEEEGPWAKFMQYGKAGAEFVHNAAEPFEHSIGEKFMKSVPLVGSVVSGGLAINNLYNAYVTDKDNPEKANYDKAEALTNAVSMIPGVGTVMGTAELLSAGAGELVKDKNGKSWNESMEPNMLTYGVERTMESVGMLNHVQSASEKASAATAHEMAQEQARGAPAANPVNPIAPDPFAPNDPLYVPPGIPRPPGM